MAINQVLGTDKALRLNDYGQLLNLVTSFSWSPNFNATDVMEMGNTARVDTAQELETSGSFDLTSSGNTAGILARMAVKRDASGNFLGFRYDSGSASGKNGYTFTQDDLAEMKFDVVMHERPNQKDFTRSLYLPYAYLTSFGGKADAAGMATESYNFAGSFVAGYPTPFHDMRAIPGKVTGTGGSGLNRTTTVQLIDLSTGGTNLTSVSSGTHTAHMLTVEGGKTVVDQVNGYTIAVGASGVVTLTSTDGYVIPTSAQVTVAVYKTTPSTVFPTTLAANRFQTSTNQPISYVKGYQANIYIAPTVAGTPVSSEQWLKVQSIDWNVDLKIETLRQIALNTQGTSIYSRVPTFPLDVSANVSVTESDWADWKQILNKTFTGSVAKDNVFDFSPANVKPSFAVVVDYFTKSGTKLQTWQFLDMRIDGYGTRQAVGGRGEISWSMKGTQFQLQGFNP